MTDHLYRALDAADVEVRDGRTVAGILVPWDTPARINPKLTEGFRSGAFDRQMERPFRVPFSRGHLGPNGTMGGQAVGRLTMLRNDKRGLYGEARVSQTEAGDELLTLLRDGVYEALSIGFRDMAPNLPDVQGITWRTAANLTELAVVVTPAYEDAYVTEVRTQACPQCGGSGEVELRNALMVERQALAAEYLRGLPRLDAA